MKRFLGSVFVVLLGGVLVLGQQEQQAAQVEERAEASYVGSETCAGCHEDQANWLKGSVHSEPAAETEKGRCESCHGPGSVHAEDPSKENILTFSVEPAAVRSDACMSCHGQKSGLLDFQRTKHRSNRVACDQCHTGGNSKAFHAMRTAHDPGLGLRAGLCQSCHSETKAQFAMPSRHRVNEGLISCSDCHHEHTGFMTGRRRSEQSNHVCTRCHSEIEGPFVFEHLPAKVSSCGTCHAPHGTPNPRLLVRANVRSLCLECHTSTPRSHDLSKARFQNCTVCHTAVHGSNHSELLFQ